MISIRRLARLSPKAAASQTASLQVYRVVLINVIKGDAAARVESLTEVRQLEALKEQWLQWQWHPNCDFEFFRYVVSHRKDVIRPHVLAVRRGGETTAIIAGRLEQGIAPVKLGYKTLWRPSMRTISVPYGGVLGELDAAASHLVVQTLETSLKSGDAGRIFFNSLQEGTPLLKAVTESPGWLRRDRLADWTEHWKMSIPKDLGQLLSRMKSKHRSEIRRNSRRLREDNVNQIEFRTVREAGCSESLCRDVEEVARKTYQRGLGQGFVYSEENVKRFEMAAASGHFRGYVLYAQQRAKAYWIGEISGRTYYPTYTGYDPEFRRYEVGTLVLLHALEQLATEGVSAMDFGFGDAFYKSYFGDESWRERTISLYAPKFKGVAVNISQGVATRLHRAGTHILAHVGILNRFKRAWRDRLARPSDAGPSNH
jgi:hypothetical protein